MIEEKPDKGYREYVIKLRYDDLIDIQNHIDREKYPEKYETVRERIKEIEGDKKFVRERELQDKAFSSKVVTFAISIGGLGAAILFEYFLRIIFSDNAALQQIGRISFIFLVTFYIAIRTRKDFDASVRTLNILLIIGLGISWIIGVVPRFLESGLRSAINLMVLKENMLFSPENVTYSIKSNFIVLFGYGFACWGGWCILLNKLKK